MCTTCMRNARLFDGFEQRPNRWDVFIGRRGIANCVEAGIDCIEHGHFIDPALAAAMKEKETALVPTLYVYRLLAERNDIPAYTRDKARAVVDQHAKALTTAWWRENPWKSSGAETGTAGV